MSNPSINEFKPSIDERVTDLFELSELFSEFMRIERATYRDGRPETDGEHTLHVMFLGVAYAAKYHPELDPAEVAMFFMVHDLDEVCVGDVNSLTANEVTMAAKEVAEETSRQFLRQKLASHPFILNYLERYWDQVEPAACFARSFEKNDPSFAHIRDGGSAIRTMGIDSREQYCELDDRAIGRMAKYATPDVLAVRRILGERVMKVTFDTV